ncbi:MAG: nucleotide sugar dehydrogenase, partial [Sphingomicrobium sp.]
MDQPDPPKRKIVVIGLGYVGLPLAVALAQKFAVTGIDADERRVAELLSGHDRTREVARETLEQSRLTLTSDTARGHGATMYVVAVPTPVDKDNRPDLSAVLSASRAVAAMIDPALRPTVVFESTVYPGVTEDICGQEIERCGNLRRGRDFRLGYSPERINPGDHEHSIDKITKVIAGEDSEVVDELAEVYGAITAGGVFRAASIRTAEAAKVIENAQRDINIAFI